MAWDSATSRRPGRVRRFVSGVFKNMLPQLEMDIATVVADYGLWDSRHWLPRTVKWTGYLGTVDGPGMEDVPTVVEPIEYEWVFDIEQIRERGGEEVPGSAATALEALKRWSEEGDSISGEAGSTNPAGIVVIIPGDKNDLSTSDLIPPPIWDGSIGGADDHAIEEIKSMLAGIEIGAGGEEVGVASSPCYFEPPVWTLRLMRYNSAEGLSAGTRGSCTLDWGKAVATVRIRTAYAEPDLSFMVQHDHPQRTLRASLYRNVSPFYSLSRAQWVSGDSVVVRATRYRGVNGAALDLRPSRGKRDWFSLRIFAERNSVFGTGAEATRMGASARLMPWWGGLTDTSVGGGGEIMIRGTTGRNPNVSASVTGALIIPLSTGWSAALEAGAARTWGDPADYDLWSVGEHGDLLRGYPAGTLAGQSLWRGRTDLQRSVRFLRVSLFADWALVDRADLYSAGVGLVFMDGLMRIDIARGLTSIEASDGGPGSVDAGWQVHWRADSFF